MKTILWNSNVGVLQEEVDLEVLTVDDHTYRSIIGGLWISDNTVYNTLKKNNFKIVLANRNGEMKAIRTFGVRFALFVGKLS